MLGEGPEKEQWPLPALLSGRTLPPALALIPDISVPPHMSQVPFSLLLLWWSSEGVSSVSLCVGPFIGTAWDSSSLSFTASLPSGVYSQKLADLFSRQWNPGLGGQVYSWDPLLPRYQSLFLSATNGCGTSPFHNSVPPISCPVVSSLIP